MSIFLTFIIFFVLVLSSTVNWHGLLNFYPMLTSLSGDFASVTSVVIVVTFSVIIFTFWYFNLGFFYWVLVLFVGAMTILLSSHSWSFLLLGWDLLGVASYLLVLIYYNKVGNDSAINVFLVNRLGDCFMLVLFVSCLLFSANYFLLSVWLFCLSFCSLTKSAQFPFTFWLPMAIEAPTPVSALVHSSTLVVAGYILHLLIWGGGFSFNGFFLIFGTLTIFLGGLNMLFESDLNKWIAFSTGLNMGILFLMLGFSWFLQSLNHMGAHAFYKSGIFLSAGIILISSFGSQDIRSVGKGGEGFIFFLCSLGVLLVPTFFSNHIVFSFLYETNLLLLLVFFSTMLFLMWTTVGFFLDFSNNIIKNAGVVELFLFVLLLWNLSYHAPIDLPCGFNWAFLVFLGLLISLKAKNISNSSSLTTYQNYFCMNEAFWYQSKVWSYYLANR